MNVLDQSDERWMPAACSILEEHYQTTGETEKLRQVRERLDQHEADAHEARRERSTIKPGDRLLPHGLSAQQIDVLRRILSAEPECASAWLVRKHLRVFPDRALFLLCVRGWSSRWLLSASDREKELVKRLSRLHVELPGQVLVIARQGRLRRLAARIMSRTDAIVFSRHDAVSAAN
jgi:hypothetical protein